MPGPGMRDREGVGDGMRSPLYRCIKTALILVTYGWAGWTQLPNAMQCFIMRKRMSVKYLRGT